MTTEVLSFPLASAGTASAGQGKMFYIKSATAPLTITAEKSGTGGRVRKFTNVPAGFKFTAASDADGFTYLRILNGATAQTVELIVGDDDVELSNAVSVTGAVTTQSNPAQAFADTAPVVTAGGTHALFAANLARRRITVWSDPRNAGDAVIGLKKTGGANIIGFLVPGQYTEFTNIAGLDYVCTNGGDTIYIAEET